NTDAFLLTTNDAKIASSNGEKIINIAVDNIDNSNIITGTAIIAISKVESNIPYNTFTFCLTAFCSLSHFILGLYKSNKIPLIFGNSTAPGIIAILIRINRTGGVIIMLNVTRIKIDAIVLKISPEVIFIQICLLYDIGIIFIK